MQCITTAAKLLGHKLRRRDLLFVCLAWVLLLGMATHGFMFANRLPNHDNLVYYAGFEDAGAEVGRFALTFFWKLFSTLSTPWFNGILGLCFLGLACYFLCDAFALRAVWQPLALGSLLVTYPANISAYTYMHMSHLLMLGILIATMAAWCAHKRGWWWLGVPVCTLVATGIYQAFLMLVVALLIALVMQRTLCISEEAYSARRSWGFAIGCAAGAIAGLLMYFAVIWLQTHVGALALSTYQGVDTMGSLDLASIPQRIADAYDAAWQNLIAKPPAYTTKVMRVAQLGILACGALAVGVGLVRLVLRKRFAQAALLLVCAALLPLVGEGIYFMGDDIVMHLLTEYPLVVCELAAILLLPTAVRGLKLPRVPLRRVCATVLLGLHLLYGFTFCMLANQAYYRLHMSFTRAEHLASRIADRIERLDGYHPGIRMVSVGYLNHENSLLYFEYDIADRFLSLTGIRNEVDYFWPNLHPYMLSRIVGLPVTAVDEDDLQWTPQLQAFVDAMPCYPTEGSVAIYKEEEEELVVVKLS